MKILCIGQRLLIALYLDRSDRLIEWLFPRCADCWLIRLELWLIAIVLLYAWPFFFVFDHGLHCVHTHIDISTHSCEIISKCYLSCVVEMLVTKNLWWHLTLSNVIHWSSTCQIKNWPPNFDYFSLSSLHLWYWPNCPSVCYMWRAWRPLSGTLSF